MRKYRFIMTFFVLTLAQMVMAQGSSGKAEQYYKDGNYEAAAEIYDSLLNQYPRNSDLLFNAGNTQYKLGRTGKSILYYERAAKYSRKDKHIDHNLKLAQLRATDKIEATPGFFIVTWWKSLAKTATANIWTILALLTLWWALTLFMLYLFHYSLWVKKISFYLASLLLLTSFLFAGLRSQSLKNLNTHNFAVLQQSSISVKNEPVNGSTDLFILHEGIKFQVLDESGNWSKIKLADGKEGWVNSDAFERI